MILLLVGLGLVGYPLGTDLYQDRQQARLERQFASSEMAEAYRQRQAGAKEAVDEGDSLTRLRIPDLGVNVVVVEGTSMRALRAGAGHYPETPLPCQMGNVSIAGHRTTFGKPFANIDRLRPGDLITLQTPIGGCTYRIDRPPYIVGKYEYSVVAPTSGRTLTLTTCHPRGSAEQRLIVKATFLRNGIGQT